MRQLNNKAKAVEPVFLSVNMKETGANIKRLIKTSGYSVEEIRVMTCLSTNQAVYKWCRGESLPSTETQLILCKVFDLEAITDLLVVDGEPFLTTSLMTPSELYFKITMKEYS